MTNKSQRKDVQKHLISMSQYSIMLAKVCLFFMAQEILFLFFHSILLLVHLFGYPVLVSV